MIKSSIIYVFCFAIAVIIAFVGVGVMTLHWLDDNRRGYFGQKRKRNDRY
jgi:hypothetical protein